MLIDILTEGYIALMPSSMWSHLEHVHLSYIDMQGTVWKGVWEVETIMNNGNNESAIKSVVFVSEYSQMEGVA